MAKKMVYLVRAYNPYRKPSLAGYLERLVHVLKLLVKGLGLQSIPPETSVPGTSAYRQA